MGYMQNKVNSLSEHAMNISDFYLLKNKYFGKQYIYFILNYALKHL